MRTLTTFLMFVVISTAAMAAAPTEKDKIDYLLGKLATSHVSFIRNGEEHNGAWAKAHLEKKFKDLSGQDLTADEFIRNVASTSTQTGKPYLIKSKDGHTEEAGKWFKEQLDKMPAN